MAILRRRYLRANISDTMLQAKAAATAAIVSNQPTFIDIEVDDALDGAEIATDELMASIGFVLATGIDESEAFITASDPGYNLDVYVDGVNGDDTNAGLSTGTALATLGGLYKKFPLWCYNGARLRVNLAGVGGFGTSATDQLVYGTDRTVIAGGGEGAQSSYVYRGPQMTRIVPTTGPPIAALDVVPVVTVGERSRFDFTTAAPGWTANDLRSFFLRIKRGADLVIYEIPITENTTDTIFVDTKDIAGLVVAATDTAEIVQPAVMIDGPGGDNFGVVAITGTNMNGSLDPDTSGHLFERLAFGFLIADNLTGLVFDRCRLTFGGFFVRDTVSFISTSTLFGVQLEMCGTANNLENPRHDSPGSPINAVPFVGYQGFFGRFGIGAFVAGPSVYYSWWNLSVYASDIDGVLVDAQSALVMGTLQSDSHDSALQGSGNGTILGVGLRCQRGGLARINGGGLTTITGGAGDLKVGIGAAVPYGAGAGGFEEVAGFNGNLHRLGGSTAAVPLGDMSQINTFVILN